MADPIGISFMPTADASANGPRQAGIEGQGGSDLAQAFKILNLHLPRVLGAAAIAPKRLLTSQGSGAFTGGGGSPYAQIFQALLQSIAGGMAPDGQPQSFSSLFGTSGYTVPGLDSGGDVTGGTGGGGGGTGGVTGTGGAPPPLVTPGGTPPRAPYGGPITDPTPPPSGGGGMSGDTADTYSTRYL